MPYALGIDDDEVLLAALPARNDVIYDFLLVAVIVLGNQNRITAGRNAAPERNIARMASHNLDDRAALVRRARVAHLIDRVDCGVDRRVKAYRVLGAGNIEVNGPRHADRIDAELRELARTLKGAVAADDHHTVDAVLFADFRRLALAFLRHHLHAARRIEDGAAAVDDVRDAARIHVDKLLIEQTGVTSHNALYLHAVVQRGANHRADCRIHTGGIAAARQNTNGLNFLCHNRNLLTVPHARCASQCAFVSRENYNTAPPLLQFQRLCFTVVFTFSAPNAARSACSSSSSAVTRQSRPSCIIFFSARQ